MGFGAAAPPVPRGTLRLPNRVDIVLVVAPVNG